MSVLVVAQEPGNADRYLAELEGSGIYAAVDVVATPFDFCSRLRTRRYDLVLTDYHLPRWTGMSAMILLRALGSDAPVILVTDSLGDESAVECLKQGVADYVLRGNLARLPLAVRRALEEKHRSDQRARALGDCESRFRKLLDTSFDAIAVTQEGVVREVNRAFAELMGYDVEDVVGRPATDFVADQSVEVVRRRMADGVEGTYEFHARRKDGRTVPMMAAARNHEVNGRPGQVTVLRPSSEQPGDLEAATSLPAP